jgi:hypothetical protein
MLTKAEASIASAFFLPVEHFSCFFSIEPFLQKHKKDIQASRALLLFHA